MTTIDHAPTQHVDADVTETAADDRRGQGRGVRRPRSSPTSASATTPCSPTSATGSGSGAAWPRTPAAPAPSSRSGCGYTERYVREWLAAQAAAGYVTYDPATQSFTLPAEHALVLADEDGPAFMASGFEVLASVWATVDQLAHGYASGEGLGWHAHDSRLFVGFERFFRPVVPQPARPRVAAERARAGRAARGGDPRARRRLRAGHRRPSRWPRRSPPRRSSGSTSTRSRSAGPRSRPTASVSATGSTFEVAEAQAYEGSYDLICMFDTLHDLGDPVGALAYAREHLADGGWFFAVEPNAGDRLEDNLHPLGLIWYASGHNLCVPNAVSQGGAALGNQAGPARTLQTFADGGFTEARKVTESAFNMVIAAGA